ncbi:hypothetical protein R6Z07F_015397 [Ovis aries]
MESRAPHGPPRAGSPARPVALLRAGSTSCTQRRLSHYELQIQVGGQQQELQEQGEGPAPDGGPGSRTWRKACAASETSLGEELLTPSERLSSVTGRTRSLITRSFTSSFFAGSAAPGEGVGNREPRRHSAARALRLCPGPTTRLRPRPAPAPGTPPAPPRARTAPARRAHVTPEAPPRAPRPRECGLGLRRRQLTAAELRSGAVVRMAEEQELARLCKLPTQPSHPHCVSNTYRSAQHSQALLRGLLALRDSGILFDVVLVVEGKQLEAHRILLAASCDYFRGMFAGGLKEMEQEEVLIHGVSYSAMRQILHFIYTAELELSLSNVQETLVAACQLQIPEIIHFCCDFLTPWVDEDNILDVYRLAELFDLSRLTEQLDAYILKNFVAFSRTDKYRQLPLEKVYALLSSNRLEVSCETEVYEGALLYHYPPEQVQADRLPLHEPPKLLETVRFPLMEAEVLQRLHDKLEPSPLRDTVAEALMYHRNESLQPSLQGPQTELRSDFQCVVGFGGIHSTPSTVLSDQAKYLNPLLGEWKHFTASLAPRMSNQGIAVLNNFVYLIGGDNNVQGFRAESRCWRYDPRHNRWFQIQPLQQEHADLCVCVVGGYIYAVAGRDYHNDLTAVERYDPATNSWAYVAPLKREVYAHAGAALDGKMYVTCGRRGEDYLKETHCYEPGSDTWHALADGPVRRAWHGMATLLDKLYVIGGSNNDAGYRRDVHQVACYSCRSGQWSSVCPLPAGHGEPGIAVLDSRIYVLGGRSHNRGSRTGYVHIYDAGKDSWEEGPPLDNSISGLAACVLTLPRSLLLEPPRGTPDRSQADPDFASEVMSVSDWEEFDNSSED